MVPNLKEIKLREFKVVFMQFMHATIFLNLAVHAKKKNMKKIGNECNF